MQELARHADSFRRLQEEMICAEHIDGNRQRKPSRGRAGGEVMSSFVLHAQSSRKVPRRKSST